MILIREMRSFCQRKRGNLGEYGCVVRALSLERERVASRVSVCMSIGQWAMGTVLHVVPVPVYMYRCIRTVVPFLHLSENVLNP